MKESYGRGVLVLVPDEGQDTFSFLLHINLDSFYRKEEKWTFAAALPPCWIKLAVVEWTAPSGGPELKNSGDQIYSRNPMAVFPECTWQTMMDEDVPFGGVHHHQCRSCVGRSSGLCFNLHGNSPGLSL
ncbi:uncharacterized protein V6R79_003185 [Siganus canaliculatus]